MEGATPNEIAGFCVGAFLVAATVSAPRVDFFIAQGQRRSLGLCVACGGLRRVHCSKCKGRGRVMPGWNFMNILPQLINVEELNSQNSSPCKSCTGKGHFPCTSCCNMEAT